MLHNKRTPPKYCKTLNCSCKKSAESMTAVNGSRSVATVSAIGFRRAAPQLYASNASAAVTTPKYKTILVAEYLLAK